MRTRSPILPMLFAAATLGGCGMLDHAIGWAGLALFGSLLVILVVELADWLGLVWRRWRGEVPPPGPFLPGDTVHKLGPEPTALRRRHLWRPRVVRRTFGAGMTDADPESER